jgi:DNA repair exonuclease SbcCD ATPase subunit
LAAGEKKTKKELDQTKQELIAIKEKADSVAQEKLLNEEKYAAMMKKHTTCDEDKKKLLQQIAKLEGEMASLRATAEELKMAMNKSKQNSARSLVEVVTPSTAKFNQEVHE